MNRSAIFETIVGVVVVAVAAVFMVYAYSISGKEVGKDHYRLSAVFGRVDGITVGADVRIAGVKVGSVASNQLNLQTYEADLQLAIDNDVPIPEDSVAKIVSDGFLGGAHVAIEPGASEEMLREGEKITMTRGAVDLLGLALEAYTNSSSGKDSESKSDQSEKDPLGDL